VLSGVNFTNVLRAAFAPVDLRPTYWRTAQRVQSRSWADFLVLWTRKIGHRFVGETEWRKRMTTSAFALCTSGLVKLTPDRQQINTNTLNVMIGTIAVATISKTSMEFRTFIMT